MILHCVFFSFRADAPDPDRRLVLSQLAELCGRLDGVISFETGPNRDFEAKSADYRDGFVIRFSDQSALQSYARHPTHQRLGAQLCALCENGAEGLIVFDLDVPSG